MINQNGQITVFNVGAELTPVISIDNFLQSTISMVKGACNGPGFRDVTSTFYPGHKAPILKEHRLAVVDYVTPLVRKYYHIPDRLTANNGSCFYGLVSQSPSTLKPPQCIPHIDNAGEFDFAVMLYLGEGDFGGTSFYRHIESGYERITEDRENSYFQLLDKYMNTNEIKESKYFYEDGHGYERIGQMKYQANRLVIYPSSLLHSGDIKSEMNISSDPSTGRLTANFFMRFA
ncbi:MAG: DUF6445 family protein [Pseudomonadales bacterium]